MRARALVLESEGWDHGVIGIVASPAHRDAVHARHPFSRDGDLMRGSGRSVEGVHLFEALRPFEHMFVKFGGHAQAAGMTMHLRHFDAFAKVSKNSCARGTTRTSSCLRCATTYGSPPTT